MLKNFFLNAVLASIAVISCTSTNTKNIYIKELICDYTPILLINEESSIYETKDSIAIFNPICFDIQNNTGNDIIFEYQLIGEIDLGIPISKVGDSIFINRSNLDSKNYFKLKNKKVQSYALFYPVKVSRLEINNIELENSKKLFKTINYVQFDSKNKLGNALPSLIIKIKISEGKEEYNLYYYTDFKKFLIINYDSVIKYATEKKDTVSALKFARTSVLDYESLSEFSVENYKNTIDKQSSLNQK